MGRTAGLLCLVKGYSRGPRPRLIHPYKRIKHARAYKKQTGNMPTGQMTVAKFARSRMSLPGYEAYGAIVITYRWGA